MLSRKTIIAATAASVALVLLLKFLIDQGGAPFSQVLQLPFSVSLLFVGGFMALTIGSLLRNPRPSGGSLTLRLLNQISEYPLRNFLIGFILMAYLSLIRPPIAVDVPYLPYVEWASIVLTIYALYSLTGFSTKESYVSSEALSWTKHVQEVNREISRSFVQLTSFMESFVNQGVKEPLLVSLALHLQRLGETEEDILKTLGPLVSYRESAQAKKSSSWASLWKKREPPIDYKKKREELLTNLMNEIKRS